MNELVARDVVLVRAIETADRKSEILTENDRQYATRSAKELAQWQASDSQSQVTADHFLQQRAEQILKRMAERTPSFGAYVKRRNSLHALLNLVPVLALVVGAGLDRIANPHRVDLLSAPLLLIIGWNLLVYIAMLVWMLLPSRSSRWRNQGLIRALRAGRSALPRKMPTVLANAVLAFTAEWTALSSKLTGARLGRTMHISAALFAVGAMLSLYARGVLTQYAAGWESTFLSAQQLHSLLSVLFFPAVSVFPLQAFSIADIEALRFTLAPSPMDGARWVHLYVATLFLLVVMPRALLAAVAHWQATRLSQSFPLDFEQPYYRKLIAAFNGASGQLRVIPYSFTLDEARDKGLKAIAATLLGEHAQVLLRPSIPYGDEPQDALADIAWSDPGVTLTAVLFNLAATPEKENHGALLKYLLAKSPRPIAVLIDESAYLERVGGQTGGKRRMVERIALWQQFCSFHHAPATLVNLIDSAAHPLDAGVSLSASVAP